MAQTETTHVAILPSPGMGHLIPFVEFAKQLVHHHNLSITFMVPTFGSPSKAQKSVLESLPTSINSIFLPAVSLTDIPEDAKIETVISLAMARSLPALRDMLKSLVSRSRVAALVVDLFGTDAFDVAREFNVSPYIFFTSTYMTLSLLLHLPKLDQMVSCDYKEMVEPVKLPGCIPVHAKDLIDPLQDRKNDCYKRVLYHSDRYKLAEGIMINSFVELEEEALRALKASEPEMPPVYPIGPLVNMGSSGGSVEESDCLKWLDDQPRGSVLYVSFGSGGTLSRDRINELALGLELSGQRFLWVVRSPNDKAANATFFDVHSQNDPFDFLPKGFLDRTKGQGLVVPSWAPQAQVLSHRSTGGFLTHCGWNSTLESVVSGVPLITWPLYAEQRMNAVMLTEGIKVALRPKPSENGLIVRQEIGNVVRNLMEGEEGKKVRSRMKDLKDAAARALNEAGTSARALSDVVLKWKNHKN